MLSILKCVQKVSLLGLFLGSMFASVFADTLTVSVSCNGQPVPNLPVTVYDSLYIPVSDVQPTDSQGNFQILNSESYTAPFYMWFTNKEGSTCGSYYVFEDSATTGTVQLDYYPVELPCSCSKLIN